MVGNSSSGLSEVPSLKKPTINIGIRQKGRLLAKSIINTENTSYRNLNYAFKKLNQKNLKKN